MLTSSPPLFFANSSRSFSLHPCFDLNSRQKRHTTPALEFHSIFPVLNRQTRSFVCSTNNPNPHDLLITIPTARAANYSICMVTCLGSRAILRPAMPPKPKALAFPCASVAGAAVGASSTPSTNEKNTTATTGSPTSDCLSAQQQEQQCTSCRDDGHPHYATNHSRPPSQVEAAEAGRRL